MKFKYISIISVLLFAWTVFVFIFIHILLREQTTEEEKINTNSWIKRAHTFRSTHNEVSLLILSTFSYVERIRV